MALKFEASEWINASPNIVYGFATNLDLAGKWMPNFVRMEKLTPGAFGPGTRFRETRKMFGKTATELFEVLSTEPPRRFVLGVDGTQGSSKRGHYEFAYELLPESDGTRVLLTGTISKLSWFGRGIGRLFLGKIKRICAADLEALKQYIENQSASLRHTTAMMVAFTPPNPVKALPNDE